MKMRTRFKDRKQRLSLTLLFSGVIFIFLALSIAFAALIILLLIRLGYLRTDGEIMRTESIILLSSLICMGIGIILSATVGRIPLRYVNEIINGMNRLADGDFKTRLHFGGGLKKLGVIRELSDSFNRMASELESTEMMRTDFIDDFSHEFKTPIASIAGFARILRRKDISDAEFHEYLGIIESEALRLSTMATNILNMNRIENQTILTDVGKFNLSEQLRNCVLLLEDKWSRKNLELLLDFHEYDIEANEELLKQVWLNLLDNAIKFTPDYGVVEISVEEQEEGTAVSVINSGSGIPPESMERIFQKFYQGDRSRATGGNGIGLAVVRKIVELHDGSIHVESQNGRTEFTVILPMQTE